MSGAWRPARYEVRVQGVLDGRWSAWLGGLQVSSEGGESILSGTLPDQSALHGVLDKVFDLGLAVITVRRLPPEEQGESGDETHPHPAAEGPAGASVP